MLGGEVSEDLFFRLNVITLNLPALRQRKEDIPALFGASFGWRTGKTDRRIQDTARLPNVCCRIMTGRGTFGNFSMRWSGRLSWQMPRCWSRGISAGEPDADAGERTRQQAGAGDHGVGNGKTVDPGHAGACRGPPREGGGITGYQCADTAEQTEGISPEHGGGRAGRLGTFKSFRTLLGGIYS